MKYFFLISIILISSGCKKDENHKRYTEVRVEVKNPVTGLPINDVTCSVLEQNSIGSSSIIKQSFTQNGLFEFGFIADRKKSYVLVCEANLDKYTIVTFVQYVDLVKYQSNSFEFELVPKGNLRYGYKNINCIDANDGIIIYLENIDVPSYNGFYPQWKFGCLDVLTSFSKVPSGKYHWEWHVVKSGSTTVFHDTTTIGADDSLTYLIEY
jgi:hypothetical protein